MQIENGVHLMKQKTSLPFYRLTLSQAALLVIPNVVKFRRMPAMLKRADGKIDILISLPLLDQLKTASLPKENLSDTVLRLAIAQAQR